MSARSIIKQALVTMGTMYTLNLVATSAGGSTRRVIRGEAGGLLGLFGFSR